MCPQLNPATWRINRLHPALATEYGVAEAEGDYIVLPAGGAQLCGREAL